MSKLQMNRIDREVITRHGLFNTTHTFEYNYVSFIFITEVLAVYSNMAIYLQNLSMPDFTKPSHAHLLRSIPHLPMKFSFNARRGSNNFTTENGNKRRFRRKFQSTQAEEIQEGKEQRHQNMTKRQERLKVLSASKSDYLRSLDMKECMLEVQRMLVGKLAAEANHFKGLTVISELSITDFDERVKEVAEVIQALQY